MSCILSRYEQVETHSRRGARATLGIFDIGARTLRELLEKEGALETCLLDLALETVDTQLIGLVFILDLFGALLELDALAPIGFLDGGRERGGICYEDANVSSLSQRIIHSA